MKPERTFISWMRLLLAVALLTGAVSTRAASIGASGDPNMPSTRTIYFVGDPINESITFSPTNGPWLKDLWNNGANIPSGTNVLMTETLTNGGAAKWTDWHEEIVTRTTIFQPQDAPGFLFRTNSLSLMADYGSGFISLTEGSDYTLATTPYSGPSFPGNNDNWEAISIFFAPGKEIAPGQTLEIQQQYFEVFGNADLFRNGDAARIGEFPTTIPEPAGLSLCGLAVAALLLRRRHAAQAR